MKTPAQVPVGPVLQGEIKSEKPSPDTAPASQHQDHIDPRRIFLLACAIRFNLVERDEMSLDEAFSREFVERFREIGRLTCQCEREMIDHFDTQHREICERRLRAWRWSRS